MLRREAFIFLRAGTLSIFLGENIVITTVSDGVLTVKQKLAYHLDKKDENRKLKVHNTREELV